MSYLPLYMLMWIILCSPFFYSICCPSVKQCQIYTNFTNKLLKLFGRISCISWILACLLYMQQVLLLLHEYLSNCLRYSDEKVPTELKKAIMHARNEKKLTQAQLAQVSPLCSPECVINNDMVATHAKAVLALACKWFFSVLHRSKVNHKFVLCALQIINEKPQVIQEYESGKAIPNQQIISKLERALGAKLRGKK